MFWEIASVLVAIAQAAAYQSAIDKYTDKLTSFAQWLCDSADLNRDHYVTLRECDIEFYEYYKSLPEYQICESNINRSKGAAFAKYGSNLRRSLRTTRGYSSLSKVHLNNHVSKNAFKETALTRTVTRIKENDRVDRHIFQKWSAIVSAPINVERYNTSAGNYIIQSSFKDLKALSEGFNSANALIGVQLDRILN